MGLCGSFPSKSVATGMPWSFAFQASSADAVAGGTNPCTGQLLRNWNKEQFDIPTYLFACCLGCFVYSKGGLVFQKYS